MNYLHQRFDIIFFLKQWVVPCYFIPGCVIMLSSSWISFTISIDTYFSKAVTMLVSDMASYKLPKGTDSRQLCKYTRNENRGRPGEPGSMMDLIAIMLPASPGRTLRSAHEHHGRCFSLSRSYLSCKWSLPNFIPRPLCSACWWKQLAAGFRHLLLSCATRAFQRRENLLCYSIWPLITSWRGRREGV